jgi:DNA-binding NarL/FixJ family response regulator
VTSTPRVVLAEPDRATRTGLRTALMRGEFAIAAEAADTLSAVDAVRSERPDLAVVAAELPEDGVETVRRLAALSANMPIVVLSQSPSGEEVVAGVLAGASGYLGKDIATARLPHVLHRVLAGEVTLPRRYTAHVVEALRGRAERRATVLRHARHAITDRQWEILNLLAEGRSTAEMARSLGISEVTARRHVSSVLPKLGVTDRASAVKLLRERSDG